MTVSEATSGAALSGVSVLKAAPEVAKTNRFYNKLTNTDLQAFSPMHILEVLSCTTPSYLPTVIAGVISVGYIGGMAPAQAWLPCSR